MREGENTVGPRRGESEVAVRAQFGSVCRMLGLPCGNQGRSGIRTGHVIEDIIGRSGLQRIEDERSFRPASRKVFTSAAIGPNIIAGTPLQRNCLGRGLSESGSGRSIGITGQYDSAVRPGDWTVRFNICIFDTACQRKQAGAQYYI